MNPLIFVIEDVTEIAELISLYLSKANMEVRLFPFAEQAFTELERGIRPNLVILDLNLLGMSGFEFLHSFRERYRWDVPILIVSARDADEDIIRGLGIGADEFVVKPFSPRVLVARVEAHLRRHAVSVSEEVVRFDDFTLLLDSRVLRRGMERIALSAKEFAVLEYLVKHAGWPLTPKKIYAGVWKVGYGDLSAVAVYVQRLRRKIEPDPSSPIYIKTVHGLGYLFNKELIVHDEPAP
ncbi:MAG: response regulator transcription factor [Treponema sp.]|nr:response regulator transcription factor [Treponema sp.]